MKIIPKHKYLMLAQLRISGYLTMLHLEANEIYTGARILKLMKDKDFISAQAFGPKSVYDITAKRVYLCCVDARTIPSVPELLDDEHIDQHLVPLQLLMDLEPSKLPKYVDHRYETVRNLARYLIANYQGEQQ